MDPHRDVNRLLQIARPLILKVCTADSCIASTKITIGVMERLGYVAKPLSVRFFVFNAAFVRKVQEMGRMPVDNAESRRWGDECGAWAVGTGGEKRADRYHGHLVALVNGDILIDLSLDQANRPQHDIICHPLAVSVSSAFLKGEEKFVEDRDGMCIVYEIQDDESYRESPDWKDERYGRLIDHIYSLMKGSHE